MPAAIPVLLIGGILALVALMSGRKEAEASPSKPLITQVIEPVPKACGIEDRNFVSSVLSAASRETATLEMLEKAIAVSGPCNWTSETAQLHEAVRIMAMRQAKLKAVAKKTGVIMVRNVKAKTDDYICGTLPGRGYACRPRNKEWKKEAKAFQNALNVAAVKLPSPKETPKLIKVDGSIGVKTQALFLKVAGRIPSTSIIGRAIRKFAKERGSPENISFEMETLTAQLLKLVTPQKQKSQTVSGNPSPLPGVDSEQWASFVLCMKGRGGGKGLGIFKIRPLELRRYNLQDAGTGVKADYENFVAYMVSLVAKIRESKYLGRCIGQNVAGTVITLSGVLALCKQAGVKGAASWLKNPKDRQRFPHTTEAFLACNGIF